MCTPLHTYYRNFRTISRPAHRPQYPKIGKTRFNVAAKAARPKSRINLQVYTHTECRPLCAVMLCRAHSLLVHRHKGVVALHSSQNTIALKWLIGMVVSHGLLLKGDVHY